MVWRGGDNAASISEKPLVLATDDALAAESEEEHRADHQYEYEGDDELGVAVLGARPQVDQSRHRERETSDRNVDVQSLAALLILLRAAALLPLLLLLALLLLLRLLAAHRVERDLD